MATDPQDTALDFLESRERFLPVKADAILRKILATSDCSEEQQKQFCMFLDMVRARFHFEFVDEIHTFKRLYDPFDPDRDTQLLEEQSKEQREEAFAELRRRYALLVQGGNYVKLTREQLITCMESRNQLGLSVRVNLDDYEVLDVYYRGIRETTQSLRTWKTLYRNREVPVRMFSRVAILVRRRHHENGVATAGDVVLIKLFKDIVLEDLEMTSPEVRVQMKLFDKIKVGSTVAGGLATPIIKLFTAAIISPVVLIIVAVGFVGAFFKGIFSFLTSKTKYMQTLSSSLYHKNLANNVSALTRLVDAAEAEETKELLLAYYILYSEKEHDYTMHELDERVEAWLHEHFNLPHIDFEVDDAVRKLTEKDLIEVRDLPAEDGTTRQVLKAYDLPTALHRLDHWWDAYFSPNSEEAQR
jgi:uncharacterized protein DUF3754